MANSRRLLLVHAHPDDESINNAATMAHYVASGASVTLVTCTLGEEAEIIVPDMVYLDAQHEDRLGPVREVELAEAMKALGVTDHRILGGAGRFRDSGMIGSEANNREDCFWQTDLLVAALELVPVIREIKPQVLVTYDDFGGYGHPDHIKAHRVAMYATQLAAAATFKPELGAAWEISKIYWNAMPRGVMAAGVEAMKAAGVEDEMLEMNLDDLPFLVDDELVTTVIDGSAHFDAKVEALTAHVTQIDVTSGFFGAMVAGGPRAMCLEYYRLVQGPLGAERDADGRETDLFAGLDLG
jgi:N-acetyl-1-D-myo-inositol-2-amino-2-deoxy-alpha-D-glucopyranoside deacetylase